MYSCGKSSFPFHSCLEDAAVVMHARVSSLSAPVDALELSRGFAEWGGFRTPGLCCNCEDLRGLVRDSR